jgi:hypothetical protein
MKGFLQAKNRARRTGQTRVAGPSPPRFSCPLLPKTVPYFLPSLYAKPQQVGTICLYWARCRRVREFNVMALNRTPY